MDNLFVYFKNNTFVERELEEDLDPEEQAEQVAREEGEVVDYWKIEPATKIEDVF